MHNSNHRKNNTISKRILWHIFRWVRHLFNHLRKITYDPSLKDSVLELLDEYDHNSNEQISVIERSIIKNILNFGELSVDDLMTPRADIVAISDQITLLDLKKNINEYEHTRIPVYQDSLDKIIGFIHVKDVLAKSLDQENFDIAVILRKILIISPSMKAFDLLANMRASRVHIAVILDEYGGVDGLITIEDLIEAIVGEIEDEHDKEQEQDYSLLQDGSIKASARLNIKKLEELTGLLLEDGSEENDFDTVGGLVLSLVSHVPVNGEIIKHHSGLMFEILEADPRKIISILITNKHE